MKKKDKRVPMPRTRLAFERDLLLAYRAGMVDGYAIEHTDIVNEERKAEINFVETRNFVNKYEDLKLRG